MNAFKKTAFDLQLSKRDANYNTTSDISIRVNNQFYYTTKLVHRSNN